MVQEEQLVEEETLEKILEERLKEYAGKISATDWRNLHVALHHYMQRAYNRGWTDCQNLGERKHDEPTI